MDVELKQASISYFFACRTNFYMKKKNNIQIQIQLEIYKISTFLIDDKEN